LVRERSFPFLPNGAFKQEKTKPNLEHLLAHPLSPSSRNPPLCFSLPPTKPGRRKRKEFLTRSRQLLSFLSFPSHSYCSRRSRMRKGFSLSTLFLSSMVRLDECFPPFPLPLSRREKRQVDLPFPSLGLSFPPPLSFLFLAGDLDRKSKGAYPPSQSACSFFSLFFFRAFVRRKLGEWKTGPTPSSSFLSMTSSAARQTPPSLDVPRK